MLLKAYILKTLNVLFFSEIDCMLGAHISCSCIVELQLLSCLILYLCIKLALCWLFFFIKKMITGKWHVSVVPTAGKLCINQRWVDFRVVRFRVLCCFIKLPEFGFR